MRKASRVRKRHVFGLILSSAWLLFVVFLDFFYDMFPQVTIGGIKILVVAWLVSALLAAAYSGTKRVAIFLRKR